MSDAQEDRDLRADFEALRAEVGAPERVPDFDAMVGRVRSELSAEPVIDLEAARRGRLVRFGGWMSLATAASAAGLMLLSGPSLDRNEADAEFERLVQGYAATASAFESPTDALLDIPGVDLGGVPAVSRGLRDGDRPASPPGTLDGRDS